MSIAPGDHLGPYRIIDKLGEGGMGQVFRARDTRLNRDVALKILPELFATDPERLARFTREAQVLASLNHPNIAQIYDSGSRSNESDRTTPGVVFIAMELVEGEDLSAIIARGPLPLADALPIARQISDALEAAHEQGIVHRDLKPGNIKVRTDGTVKVLDFGLAKALDPAGTPASGDAMNSPTLTARATQMGMILGTAAYMSPEQARGKPVDRRADIWAFGVVLYEMLTGRRAFEGDDVSITLASVLKEDPKWSFLPADLPAPVARLLRRCLEKEPKRRLSSIGDARLELDEKEPTAAATGATTAPRARPSLASLLWPVLTGAAITAAIAAAMWPGSTAAPPSSGLERFSVLAPPGDQIYPDSVSVAISPDGTMVAFVVGTVSRSETQLWVRSLDSLIARRLEGGDGATLVFWSPDSRRLGFLTNGKLKTIARTGGRADVLADAPGPRGGVWAPSNEIIFAPDAGGPLFKVSTNGGQPTPVTKIDPARKEYSHRFPALLPDGRHFLYASLPGKGGRFDIFAGSLDDPSQRTLVGSMEAAPIYAEPGWLLYARQGVLVVVPFDARVLKITGDPIPVEDEPASVLNPSVSYTAGWSVSVSPAGGMAYYSAPSVNTVATWFTASGVPVGSLNVPAGHYESAAISPDGTRAVMVKSTSPSESSLWLVDLARGGAVPLSTGLGRNDSPAWSPDGSRVVWAADREGPQNLYVKNLNEVTPESLLFASDRIFKATTAWSADGIVLAQLDPDTGDNLWLVDPSGKRSPTALVIGSTRDRAGAVSLDSKWLSFTSDDSGRFQLFVQPFPAGGRRTQVSEKGGFMSWWSRDGRQLVYVSDDFRTLWRVDVQPQPGPVLSVGTPTQLGQLPADTMWVSAMPDLQRFLVIAPERVGTGSITIVKNWREALNKK